MHIYIYVYIYRHRFLMSFDGPFSLQGALLRSEAWILLTIFAWVWEFLTLPLELSQAADAEGRSLFSAAERAEQQWLSGESMGKLGCGCWNCCWSLLESTIFIHFSKSGQSLTKMNMAIVVGREPWDPPNDKVGGRNPIKIPVVKAESIQILR